MKKAKKQQTTEEKAARKHSKRKRTAQGQEGSYETESVAEQDGSAAQVCLFQCMLYAQHVERGSDKP